MSTSAVNGSSSSSNQQTSSTNTDKFAALDMEEFLGLLVAELQNQDPMNPMDNQEILQQVSQIREIESSDRLNETLETVMIGQNMSTAAGLIGQTITGLSENEEMVTGVVDRVSVVGGTPKLHIGDEEITLNNVSGINAAEDASQESGETS